MPATSQQRDLYSFAHPDRAVIFPIRFSDTYGNLSLVESYADLAEMAAQHRLSGDGVLTSALKKAQNLGWIERLERGKTTLYRLGTLGRLELQRLLDDQNRFERSCLLGVVDD